MLLLSRTIHFNAAQRLYNPEKSEEWNRATYGDAANPADNPNDKADKAATRLR